MRVFLTSHPYFSRFFYGSLLFSGFWLFWLYTPTSLRPWVFSVLWLALAGELFFFSHNTSPRKKLTLRVLGFFILFYSFLQLIQWHHIYHCLNITLIVFLLPMIWLNDTMAFVAGNFMKGPRLCPQISPQKTWSGALVGFMSSSLWGVFFLHACHIKTTDYYALAFWIPLMATLGDLVVSWMKRTAGVKDTSQLIPGHGGLWDRLDSTVFVLASLFVLDMLLADRLAPLYQTFAKNASLPF